MDCVLCYEPITNPLCPDCLGEAVDQWLCEVAPQRREEFAIFTGALHTNRGERCVHCTGRFKVCTYCYCKDVFNWLGEGALQLRFVRFFNFLV